MSRAFAGRSTGAIVTWITKDKSTLIKFSED